MRSPSCVDCCCVWACSHTRTIRWSSWRSGYYALREPSSTAIYILLTVVRTFRLFCFRAWPALTTRVSRGTTKNIPNPVTRTMMSIWNMLFWMLGDRDEILIIPGLWSRGPENPPLSHFPSSWPRKLDQAIPTGDLRSFLRLMIFLNLDFTGFDVSSTTACSHQTKVVTDWMLPVFRPGLVGISRDNFVETLADMVSDYSILVFLHGSIANLL